ncbi:MAG: hypothetical protein OXU71_03895 [Gammaproteobacteria bacterium]|nr:hypothetical protein [Gammaproteobacteria bacterium]
MTEQAQNSDAESQRVVIVDIRMRFWSMVMFMVKAAIAFIPAMFILFAIGTFVMFVFMAIFQPQF